MVGVEVDRGGQLEQLRATEILTDVDLVSGQTTVPCHKLILSLHSAFFRTLFHSEGFLESGQERILLNHINPKLLQSVVTFIYTGKLDIDSCNAVELLEIHSVLQLEDETLVKQVETVLTDSARQTDTFQQLFILWNTGVTYDLAAVVEAVLTELEVRLEEFLSQPDDMAWLCLLGWEELQTILERPGLCVQSEAVLLGLVLDWAEDKVGCSEDYTRLTRLLLSLRLARLDKRMVVKTLSLKFPDWAEAGLVVSPLTAPRACQHCSYLLQFKLAPTQVRNIEDFIDTGQKSLFLGFRLAGGAAGRVAGLTRMQSMVGTAAGNYNRPLTPGSTLLQYRHLLLVVGGTTDSVPSRLRTDILVFDTLRQAWVTSLKQFVRAKPGGCRLHQAVILHSFLFLFWLPAQPASASFLERVDLEAACTGSGLDKQVVADIPADLHDRQFSCCVLHHRLYCIADGAAWSFNTANLSWSKLPPPIGTIGRLQPVLAACSPFLVLVGGRQEEATNSIQLLDTAQSTWRRLPNLNTRLSPVDLVAHCGQLYLLGWQPARNNFVSLLDRDTGQCSVLLEGLEGVWTKGTLLRGPAVNQALAL